MPAKPVLVVFQFCARDNLSSLLLLSPQASKPMLERQRRARINNSLDELKSLVLSALHQEVSFKVVVSLCFILKPVNSISLEIF